MVVNGCEKNPISPSFGVALLLNVGGRNPNVSLSLACPPIFQWLETNYLPTANRRATDGQATSSTATYFLEFGKENIVNSNTSFENIYRLKAARDFKNYYDVVKKIRA